MVSSYEENSLWIQDLQREEESDDVTPRSLHDGDESALHFVAQGPHEYAPRSTKSPKKTCTQVHKLTKTRRV